MVIQSPFPSWLTLEYLLHYSLFWYPLWMNYSSFYISNSILASPHSRWSSLFFSQSPKSVPLMISLSYCCHSSSAHLSITTIPYHRWRRSCSRSARRLYSFDILKDGISWSPFRSALLRGIAHPFHTSVVLITLLHLVPPALISRVVSCAATSNFSQCFLPTSSVTLRSQHRPHVRLYIKCLSNSFLKEQI